MAESISAWGIDIGQAGLKAIRLRSTENGERVVATAFDYVPHPKILSQPDAIPEELIREAMKTFLERNKVNNDLIAISVPGQSSLAKFIKLPPVEAGKVAEIVKYEARQQIPFDLNDVIWDYQPIGGGVEESGFMLEAEVGLFAMKRDLVYEAMKPFTNNSKEVELVRSRCTTICLMTCSDFARRQKRRSHRLAKTTTLFSIWVRTTPPCWFRMAAASGFEMCRSVVTTSRAR
jgi:type IV pilus assembly protein PilM